MSRYMPLDRWARLRDLPSMKPQALTVIEGAIAGGDQLIRALHHSQNARLRVCLKDAVAFLGSEPAARAADGPIRNCASGKATRAPFTNSIGAPDRHRQVWSRCQVRGGARASDFGALDRTQHEMRRA